MQSMHGICWVSGWLCDKQFYRYSNPVKGLEDWLCVEGHIDMSRNNRRHNRQPQRQAIVQDATVPEQLISTPLIEEEEPVMISEPTQTPTAAVVENITPTVPELIVDTVTKPVEVAALPVVDIKNEVPVIVEAEVLTGATAPSAEDTEQVTRLKLLLIDLKAGLSARGKTPEDFRNAAKVASMVTKFVIANPKPPVLDTLLAFYVENKTGVCKPEEFMKGSTTLNRTDEQQVGFLNGLFSDIANGRATRINSAYVVNVLKRTEFVEYFKRKMNALRAQG